MEQCYVEEAVKTRRILHTMPEEGWMEVRTTVFLIRVLEQFGYLLTYGKKIHGIRQGVPAPEEYDKLRERNRDIYEERFEEIFQGYTGVIAHLDTGREGEAIGFRFDLDGLPVAESDGQEHLPAGEGFASWYPGVMHACGHDGHMAVGIALAHWLMQHRENVSGRFVFIFQPAEEGVRGAKSLLTSGNFPKLDKLFGMHIGLGMKADTIGVGTRGFLGSKHLDICFKGKSAHSGNAPEEGCNSLLAGAAAAMGIHSLTQYGRGTARANVGTMQAGTGRNVVAGEAVLGVNLRADKEEILEDLYRRTEEAAKGAARMFENQVEFKMAGESACYDRVNEKLAEEVTGILQKAGLAAEREPVFGASEDVTVLMRHVEDAGGEALHLMIGARLAAAHHSGSFDFDESALELGLRTYEALILYYAAMDTAVK